jgi:class 3 adenylate cyclase
MSTNVADWLRRLGLEQYAAEFAANHIDAEILPELTADDLVGLGVTSIGHRRKLLAAIAALPAEAPQSAVKTAPAAAAAISAEAERRQLTVMFCDLVGSTALSARFDPEDLREVIGAYHRCVADTVARFAGFIAKYMGDGVLIYFGYPEAHEDDAERAIRAGLAVIEAIAELTGPERLNVRLGVASGLVVVGDLIGEGAAQERGVVGETPNLAARLQALAQPGALVIADGTRRQIGELFEVEALRTQPLAGFTEPQRAWRVVGESGVVSRFEALRSKATPLVGRDEELDLLRRRWQQAKAGEGRAVLISGEPGIGKSRLTAELGGCIESEPHTRLRYFCSPHHQDSALYPFIVQLERAVGFTRDETAEEKLAKLRELLAPGARGEDEIALLAELLSLPSPAADLSLSPQRKREMLFEALLHQLETLARSRPVLMVFEDAHWIDPTSRELLDLTLDWVARLPVLLVVTFRPEFKHAWSGQPHVTTLALNRLGGHDGAALVERLAGNAGLCPAIVDEIVARADGVPLFVEELTKAVLESGDPDNRALVASPLPDLEIPATLHASLIARLDRLGPIAKEVGQIGAVLGREFGYDLIEQVAGRPAEELRLGLERLAEAGLLFCRGVAPQSLYLFKHALVQDAAYGTVLRGRRQELHTRVATALGEHFAELVERQPELLAHHLTAAGATELAVDQWLKAGQYAAERLSHPEAIRHFERGLAILQPLSEGRERDRREIELQLARGLSLFTAEGFGSDTAGQAYARAHELSERSGDVRQLFMAIFGLWVSANGKGGMVECRQFSHRLQQLATADADEALRLQAHHSAWTTCLFSGEPAAVRAHCEVGIRLYDFERHRSHRLLYGGHDPGVCAGYMGAQARWLLGYPDTGLALGREALALSERISHPFTLGAALVMNAVLHLDREEPELALQRIEAAEALVADQRIGLVLEPRILHGAVMTAQGAFKEAVACLRDGLTKPRAIRFRHYGLARLAEALSRLGEHGEALAAVREAVEDQERSGQRRWEPELYRLKGISLFGLNRFDEGQIAFEKALRMARRQQAKAYELRAATSLARLWGEQGRRAEARDLLASVYGWFTEGFDTADLKDAAMLLSELA